MAILQEIDLQNTLTIASGNNLNVDGGSVTKDGLGVSVVNTYNFTNNLSTQLGFVANQSQANERRINIFANGSFSGSLISLPAPTLGTISPRNRVITQHRSNGTGTDLASYLFNISSNGYIVLPARTVGAEWWAQVLNWGLQNVNVNSTVSVTYPIAYDSGINPAIQCSSLFNDTGNADNVITIENVSNVGFTMRNVDVGGQVNTVTGYWLAVGRVRIS